MANNEDGVYLTGAQKDDGYIVTFHMANVYLYHKRKLLGAWWTGCTKEQIQEAIATHKEGA